MLQILLKRILRITGLLTGYRNRLIIIIIINSVLSIRPSLFRCLLPSVPLQLASLHPTELGDGCGSWPLYMHWSTWEAIEVNCRPFVFYLTRPPSFFQLSNWNHASSRQSRSSAKCYVGNFCWTTRRHNDVISVAFPLCLGFGLAQREGRQCCSRGIAIRDCVVQRVRDERQKKRNKTISN